MKLERPSAIAATLFADRRRWLLAAALWPAAKLVGCGGGGGGGTPTGGGGGATPTGKVVVKDSSAMAVVDTATGSATATSGSASNSKPGIGVSRNGFVADIRNYTGGDQWDVAILSLTLATVKTYTVSHLGGTPTSAVALNVDATRWAYSVNEETSSSNGTRIDRTYVNDLTSGALLARLDGLSEPTFADNGELYVRSADDKLHAFDTSLHDQGALAITVAETFGAYGASPDGRYVAFENGSPVGSQISVLDRTTGTTWIATAAPVLACSVPVFSPDGKFLAFQQAGSSAGHYVHVIAFEPGTTKTIDDGSALRTNGQLLSCSARFGWAR